MVNLLQGLLSDLKSTLMYNLVSFHSLGFSEQGGKSHYVPSVDQLMHAAVEGESRRWVGEVREGQKERAEGMCGSQETTKEISSASFQGCADRKWSDKADREMLHAKQTVQFFFLNCAAVLEINYVLKLTVRYCHGNLVFYNDYSNNQ